MVGETLGSYRIVSRLGAGGMGEVYLAQHTRIHRRAAIKVLLPELSSNQEVVGRFFSEARATSTIRHHGIVEVLDCDVHDSGRAYIVMELLEGDSLAGRLAKQRDFGRDLGRVFTVAASIADAVGAAHAKGIVHRDLKPDNVFLANDAEAPTGFTVKILDFGIAKLMGKDADGGLSVSARTRTGSLIGTPGYMSPEQCRGASRVDHRTDIYSLGCIVYEMLAGRLPFIYRGFGELISAHMTEPPPTFAELGVAGVPAGLEAFVRRLLAKSPDDRFATMTDVIAAIRTVEQDPGVVSTLRVSPRPVVRPARTQMLPVVAPATTFTAQAAEKLRSREVPRRSPMVMILVGLVVVGAAAFGVQQSGLLSGDRVVSPPPAAVPAPPPPPRKISITVGDAPDGLAVLVDGEPQELPLELPVGDQVHELTFRAPGFKPRVVHVDASTSRLLTLSMQPEAPPVVSPPPAELPAAGQGEPRKRRPRVPREEDLDEARKL
jgi:serine/threonine-protein kinase